MKLACRTLRTVKTKRGPLSVLNVVVELLSRVLTMKIKKRDEGELGWVSLIVGWLWDEWRRGE